MPLDSTTYYETKTDALEAIFDPEGYKRSTPEMLRVVADLFEAHPKLYDFQEITIPGNQSGCGTPGCVVGWMMAATGQKSKLGNTCYSFESPEGFFYDSITRALDAIEEQRYPGENFWRHHASYAVEMMRAAADDFEARRAPCQL